MKKIIFTAFIASILAGFTAFGQANQLTRQIDTLQNRAKKIITYTHSSTLTGDWNWISFPCLPRLGNNGYDSQSLLETIDPLEDFSSVTSGESGLLELTYEFPYWTTDDIPTLISTQGYKYYSDATGNQSLDVTGVVLDPATPIQLSASYENWIGYFIEESLAPEDAFVGVWDKLTRISTQTGRW